MPNRSGALILAIVALIGLPSLGFGQWLKYPTDGVPRNADGTPNRNAPAPRLPNGKPDYRTAKSRASTLAGAE